MKQDILVIGGGYSGTKTAAMLQQAGKHVCVISAALSLHETSRELCRSLGVEIFDNCRAVRAQWQDNCVISVQTDNAITFTADSYILATGKFLSRGLLSDRTHIWEPVLDLDVTFDSNPVQWAAADIFAPQPFETFGIKHTDGQTYKNGILCANVYAVGEVLAGAMDKDNQIDSVCKMLC